MIKLIISNSIIALSIAILIVGVVGAFWQNCWLGNLGTEKYRGQPVKKKGIIPSVMFFFPLPFTTYVYVFFRALTSKNPEMSLEKLSKLRQKIFHFHLKR